jgi:hypothetical protein
LPRRFSFFLGATKITVITRDPPREFDVNDDLYKKASNKSELSTADELQAATLRWFHKEKPDMWSPRSTRPATTRRCRSKINIVKFPNILNPVSFACNFTAFAIQENPFGEIVDKTLINSL